MDAESVGGLGEVDPRDLADFTSHYRFFFNPIRYTSLGLAVIEAMMVGLPVAGLATTEMTTVIEHGVSGFLATDPNQLWEPMRDLLDNPKLAREMGKHAKRAAKERFAIDRFAQDWEDAFSTVAGRPVEGQLFAPGMTMGA